MGKIPDKAKKVFGGIIYDIYQWKQELYDGSIATYEMAKRNDSIMILATQDDKVLLAYEEQPTKPLGYGFFGGKAESGETPEQAAKRELKEETGMESNDWELYKTYQIGGIFLDWDVHLFIARDVKRVARPELEAGEKIEISKFNFDEFVELSSQLDFRNHEFVSDMLRMRLESQRLEEFRKKILGK